MARILFFPGFWAVPGMAQNGADIIFSGILGRSGMAQNGADFIFSAHFWAVPGMAQFITFSHKTFSLPPL